MRCRSIVRHAFEDHQSEVRLRVDAETLSGVFEEAARALCELTAGDVRSADAKAARRVSLHAIDREALFADWLNELVYLSERYKEVFPDVRVESVDDHDLVATVRGVEPNVILTPVKAATMHDLHVDRKGGTWSASIVLDV